MKYYWFKLSASLFAASILLFWVNYEDIRGSFFKENINYKKAGGLIIKSKYHYHPGKKSYEYFIEYSYEVNGKVFSNSNLNFDNQNYDSKEEAEKIINDYPVGKELVIFYEDGDPSISVIDPYTTSKVDIVYIIFTLFLLSIICFLVWLFTKYK